MEKEKKNKTGMSRLMELAMMKKVLIIPAVILSALASIAAFIPYIAIFFLIREIIGVWPDLNALDVNAMINYGLIAFGGIVLNILLYFIALMCSHLAAFGTLYELKVNFASHIARVPLGFHVIVGSGKLRKIMDENIERIEEFIAHHLPDIVAAYVAPVVMIVILIRVEWRMGLAALFGIAIAFFLQFGMYGNDVAKKMVEKYQKSLENMNNASVEYIRGISVVKAFKQTAYSFKRMNDTIKEYTDVVIPYTLSWRNAFTAFATLINNIYIFVIPVAILIGVGTSDFTAFTSNFIFYMIFTPSVAATMMKTMYVNSYNMQILNGIEAMDGLLSNPELPQPEDSQTVEDFSVAFENVSFSYENSENEEALSDISFHAEQGQVTAIVGPSGGGKSTIAHLVPRFFDANDGRIKIGEVNIKDMKSDYLMDNISFVFQDVFLFKQSVRDNIRIGNRNATDEQVIEAAKAAQCHDFVMRLPFGYNTVIGTRGVHLSGGEMQRVAIARAIVKDAPIIVLDEATAFADPENEHLIQKAFERLMKNKTVIIIAHRLSTITSADNIIVLDNGHLVEEGTHDELVEKGGRYSSMWKSYNETVSWSIKKDDTTGTGVSA